MLAKIVVIEGPDKCGKATQSSLLTHVLGRYGDRAVRVEIPFNDGLTHRLIYHMLKNGQAKRWPNLFQFIQFLNKFIFQWTWLLWLRLSYDWIVLDRWKLSAIVYGNATGTNRFLNDLMYGLLKNPDVTLVLLGSSFKRATVDDVYEKDTELQVRVRDGYRSWAQHHPFDHEVIDNQGTRDEVHARIMESIEEL